tara:strand:- start:37 stop:360 length:324 start_codon:yes stop_codon:yes gene_type:complete
LTKTLHLINKAPQHSSALDECLGLILSDPQAHALMLIEDGVYAALGQVDTNRHFLQGLQQSKLAAYVLTEDLQARGISDKVSGVFSLVDYPGFVDLTLKFSKVQSWA